MRRLILGMVVAIAATLLPHVTMAGNQEVAEQIASSLVESGQLYGCDIGVRYQNGIVWLKGDVFSHDQMNEAVKIVFQTRGVTRVINDMEIAADEVVSKQLQQSPGSLGPEQHQIADSGDIWRTRASEVKRTEKPVVKPLPPQPEMQIPAPAPIRSQPLVRNEPSEIRQPSLPQNEAYSSRAVTDYPNISRPTTVVAAPPAAPRPIQRNDSIMRVSAEEEMMAPTFAPPMEQSMSAMTTPVNASAPAIELVSDPALPIQKPTPVHVARLQPVQSAPQAAQGPSQQQLLEQMQLMQAQMEQMQQMQMVQAAPMVASNEPVRLAYAQPQAMQAAVEPQPQPQQYAAPVGNAVAPARFDQPNMPNYAWPATAAYPNYAGVQYPKQYSPQAWPYIGPFYPYPQVPLGWRKVTMEWHDGWWYLDFDDGSVQNPFSAFFRPVRRH